MPALEDMRALTGEIIHAHRNRVEAISGLRGKVAYMLADFEGARQATSKSQRSVLARAKAANQKTMTGMLKGFQASRTSMSRQLHSGLSQENADRNAAVEATLAELHKSKHGMAISLHKDLAQDAPARSAAMRSTLVDFKKGRQVLAKTLQANLSRESSERKHAVGTMLVGLNATHQAMSQTLRTDLVHSNASRVEAVHTMRKDFLDEQAQVRKQRGAVRDEWQRFVTTMRPANRGTLGVRPDSPILPNSGERLRLEIGTGAVSQGFSAGPLVEPVEQLVPAPEIFPMSPPKAVEPAVEENPEFALLSNRVFKYLVDRPDGTRLVEIEGTLGASRFQMSRVLRTLMDDNMVEKRDLLYFAI